MTVSTNHQFTHRLINHRPFRRALLILTFVCIGLGLLIVPIEQSAKNRNITTPEEGLWWAITTASGVGYGDFVPVSTTGRIVGTVLQISGVVMFGLLIGIIGITLSKRQEEYYWFRLFERLNQIDQRLQDLEKKEQFLIKHSQENRENE